MRYHRSASSWRYKVIKGYRRRALKFYDESITDAEKKAWCNVIKWFDSILHRKHLNKNEAISLPLVNIELLDMDYYNSLRSEQD